MQAKQILRELPVSRRQLDLWTTKGYFGNDPKTTGTGNKRDYSDREVVLLRRIIAFVDAGVQPVIAAAIARGDVEATRKLVRAMEMCDE